MHSSINSLNYFPDLKARSDVEPVMEEMLKRKSEMER